MFHVHRAGLGLLLPLTLMLGCGGGSATPEETSPPAGESPTAQGEATATAAPTATEAPTAPVSTETADPATPIPTPLPTPDLAGPLPYETLSAYRFFAEPMADLRPNAGVLPYEVASPLWTDGALKYRFFVLPPGETVGFDAEGAWEWPVGAVLIKNFVFPVSWADPAGARRIVETRLLIHQGDGDWSAQTYVWDDAQTEATRVEAGKLIKLNLISPEGEAYSQSYLVPNTNQCGNCHEISDRFELLGPVTAQLNRAVDRGDGDVGQLAWLAEQGVFAEAPPSPETLRALINPMGEGTLEDRARSYLHANCSHCHQDGGNAHKSGLFLGAFVENPQTFGVCKTPVAAGGGSGTALYDIVPGSPDDSILIYRMSSLDPDEKMPEVGNLTLDQAGLSLIRQWIGAMDPVDCATYGANSH